MSENLETEGQEELSDLDYVDACMRSLGLCLNLLDPDGTFKHMPSEEVLREIMQAVREEYRKLSDAILALRDDEEPARTPGYICSMCGYEDYGEKQAE